MAAEGSILYGTRLLRVAKLESDGSIPVAPEWLSVTTPQQANVNPVISSGQQQELRGGDRLLAVIQEDDEEIGLDISFTDAVLDGPFMALVTGGTWDPTDGFTPRAMGVAKPRFMAELYVAQYDEGSQHQADVVGYVLFQFPNCTANIPQFSSQDRSFMAPQFTLKARDNKKTDDRFFNWKPVAALPA